ncbi:MAG: DtxR family transcriptional regulator [Clostridiaceae bacterium]|nr:DtxR family transcriptional regulator [Clostridiaceae bacterium]
MYLGCEFFLQETEKFYTVRGYELLEKNKKHLTSAMEDYLEMIYRHSLPEGYIRINNLAELLNVHASSTTKMVQRLSKLDLVAYKRYGVVVLTKQGEEIGEFLLKRHEILESFFKHLGIESVLQEVELMEHSITTNTLKNINLLNVFLENNPSFLENFKTFQKNY